MRIGLLTAGGDCPGINAAIRGVAKTAMTMFDMEVLGLIGGFSGLINGEYILLNESKLSGILTLGGTILGTSREKPFKKDASGNRTLKKPELIKKNYHQLGLDCLVCIGGNGTMNTAYLLSQMGINVVGIPKTIDNDIWGTDITFGFDSALSIATEAIDRLHTTANSHSRVMVIELMGHHAGWLALYAGMASGGDIILIPEISYNEKVLIKTLKERLARKKAYSIIVVAEGIKKPESRSAASYISERIKYLTRLETRNTILGYIQRGGTPSAMDRVLATEFGAHAVDLIVKKDYGKMVTMQNNHITNIDLEEVGGKVRYVPSDHQLIVQGRKMGVCFGDKPINGKSNKES